jgi:hypothetical protein
MSVGHQNKGRLSAAKSKKVNLYGMAKRFSHPALELLNGRILPG